jgi:hypothetical protein
MSYIASARRRRPQEFFLPNGKKIIASLPEDLESLREEHGKRSDIQVEVVIHGSPEHCDYLRETRDHHESRRAHFRQRHGPAFDEWEDMQSQLDIVNGHLERLSTNTSALNANFDKFGYGAELRTYDDDDPSPAVDSSNISTSDTLSVGSGGGQPRLGETIKLFKKPVVKQWFHKGLLWRASENTEIMAIELFFDLLYGKNPDSVAITNSHHLKSRHHSCQRRACLGRTDRQRAASLRNHVHYVMENLVRYHSDLELV